MVKGTLFGLLLLSAAVWDMRNREIPNLIPILLFAMLSTTREFIFGVDAAPAAMMRRMRLA